LTRTLRGAATDVATNRPVFGSRNGRIYRAFVTSLPAAVRISSREDGPSPSASNMVGCCSADPLCEARYMVDFGLNGEGSLPNNFLFNFPWRCSRRCSDPPNLSETSLSFTAGRRSWLANGVALVPLVFRARPRISRPWMRFFAWRNRRHLGVLGSVLSAMGIPFVSKRGPPPPHRGGQHGRWIGAAGRTFLFVFCVAKGPLSPGRLFSYCGRDT